MTTIEERDPADGPEAEAPPKEATREQKALWMYDMVELAMYGLGRAADTTKAKNYIALRLEGMAMPFERAEIHLIRPGGLNPADLVDKLKVELAQAEETKHRFMVANGEIAILLGQRIVDGDPIAITTDEDTRRIVDGLKATVAVQHKANCKAAADAMLLIVALREAREALSAVVLDHEDPDDTQAALAKVNDVLATLGIAL